LTAHLQRESGALVAQIDIPATAELSPDPESDESVAAYPPILIAGRLIFPAANGKPHLFVLGEPD
jgi:hypothetical protein